MFKNNEPEVKYTQNDDNKRYFGFFSSALAAIGD